MRRSLAGTVEVLPLPTEVSLTPFNEAGARECRALMNAVYGAMENEDTSSFEDWWPNLIADSEYDASLVLVARSGERVIGVCHGWTTAFIKDLVVDAAFRGRGVGGALLTRILAEYQRRGAPSVDLKTGADNLTAQSTYRRLGFEIVEHIG